MLGRPYNRRLVSTKRSGPLVGVRVLDLSATLMGPYCTQILADLGADVIKVESGKGDTTRYLPPAAQDDRGAIFLNLNRGKRGIVIDLKQPAGRDVLLRMCRDADVLVHSMRLPAMARLGLTYADVAAAKPSIVYVNLYGFGRNGPYADYPAYDDIIQAASGIAMLQARTDPDGRPGYVATVVADKVAGLTGCYSILAALFHRERTGEGQEVDIPMFETLTSFVMQEHLSGALYEPPISGTGYARVLSPDRRPYKTKDGFVAAMVYNDDQWRRFAAALGDPDWAKDARFASMRSRAENIDFVLAALAQVLESRTTDECLQLLRRAECPAMPLLSPDELLHDEHLESVGFWQSMDTKEGRLRFPAIPTVFSKTPGAITEAGPALGQHTVSLLRDHGYADAEIESLLSSKAVTQAAT